MPGTERSALAGEDPGEQLVILQAQSLDPGNQRLETEGEQVSDEEDDRGGDHQQATGPPETGCRVPHDPAECGMGETECRQTGERDQVRTDPHRSVEDLDGRLGQACGAATGSGKE